MAELTENLLKLKLASGVGNLLLWRLLRHFGDADRLLGATIQEIAGVEGMNTTKAEGVLESARFDPRPEMEKAVNAGINIVPYDDPEYPKPLLYSFDPPAVLYILGRLRREDQVALGIVGTRRASSYGRDLALTLAGTTARAGFTVVSGLARGIDTFAHTGALDAGGRTVGVLGCGFDHMYPEENRDLALEMSTCGAVVSEFPMAMPPSRTTFPARNRIIAGMSLGLLVIEAPLRSGSLITARLANEIGRTVFAVPGRIGDAASEGCNKLIADGAVMVTKADDILNELNPALPPPPLPENKRTARVRKTAGSLFRRNRSSGPTDPRFGGSDKDAAANAVEPRDAAPAESTAVPWTRASAKPAPEAASEKPVRRPAPPAASTGPLLALSDEQSRTLDAVAADWLSVDDVAEASGLPANRVVASLAMLKLKRLVEQGPGQTYRRARTEA